MGNPPLETVITDTIYKWFSYPLRAHFSNVVADFLIFAHPSKIKIFKGKYTLLYHEMVEKVDCSIKCDYIYQGGR